MKLPLWFFGKTGYSFVDVWSIVHVAFWVYTGSLVWSFQEAQPEESALKSRYLGMAACMLGAIAWEVFEFFMAPKHPKLWMSTESWWNAWVSDPLTCVWGVLFIWYALDNWRT